MFFEKHSGLEFEVGDYLAIVTLYIDLGKSVAYTIDNILCKDGVQFYDFDDVQLREDIFDFCIEENLFNEDLY